MKAKRTPWTVCLIALLLAGCGQSFTLGQGVVTVNGLAPGQAVLCGQVGAQLQFTGTGFLSEHGVDVTIRWDALEGTPFENGTSATTETMGTVLSDTLFQAEVPAVFGTIPLTVTLILPGGNEGTSPDLVLEVGGELGPPDAINDQYETVGNVQLVIDAATGVLVNDEDGPCLQEEELKPGPGGPAAATTATIVNFDATTTLGGTVTLAQDGSFTYDPPLGQGAPGDADPVEDTFTYTIDEDGQQDTATVTISLCEVVWFIDDTSTAAGDGSFANPFDSLTSFMAVQGGPEPEDPEAGDYIFVYEGSGGLYDGGITLLNSQKLIGQGVDLVLCGQTLVTATTNPLLTNQMGAAGLDCIVLANGNTIDGVDVVMPTGRGIFGQDASGAVVNNCTITGCGGNGVELQGTYFGPIYFGPNVLVTSCDGVAVVLGGVEQTEQTEQTLTAALTGSSFTFEGNITQVDAGRLITIANTAPGTSVIFQNGTIEFDGEDTSVVGAIDLSGVEGSFTCTSPQTILGTLFIGIYIAESGGTFSFSDTTITTFDDGLSGSGVELLNVGASTISFDDLVITMTGDDEEDAGGVGIRGGNLGGSGSSVGTTTLNVTGTSSVSMADAEDAVVIFGDGGASPFALDITLASLAVDGSPQSGGIHLAKLSGTFSVTGTTSIVNFGSAGILVLDCDCDISLPTVNIRNGSGIVGRGVDVGVNAGTLTIGGGTIDDMTFHGIAIDDATLVLNNVAFSNIDIDVIQLGGTVTVSGSGNSATMFTNLCDSAGATVTGSIDFGALGTCP